ncbi:mechanosensitive ion channel [Flavobacterium sp. LB2P84]|uniref:Mechanosensitive ion channel n=1 Tax=Flavobacterium yafengii TaxID=3041253 RepID=A0AAW6TSX6_9FLAO|nr:mechanosensitive ion channel domain-containing protein [Flavobacterium yafengii]MDI5897588.1 mechanosensitive ion channel [Flavobacterium yafengii]MDI5950177.1 mechanosensitive ion channel [Flavobacterium yafengii]MDI6033417.1 mechanosensitive ion channel [Flavobacterium yafengii]MDI6046976.1 mechanosensitive ion channel [Flavobacterium yafengii]
MTFFQEYTRELIATGILGILLILFRILSTKLVRRYAKSNQTLEHRTNLVIKYIHLFINILVVIALIIIWGVQTKDIFIALSSITTVVGVAMFAQWSILSNITSGVILFFSFPFKIGDVIKIHDKDFPIEAEIEDIGAFHVYLKTIDGEKIIYPNNLLLQKGISILKDHFDDKEFVD